ncbi:MULTISPECIES: DUF397 domain-containing protein [Streptomyces]|uniref:DUF397 domain-containing protein n=1 Tax=Streptomyces TaxID=1883 RepID=UPI001E3BC2D2|nr:MULTISPECIES: DUF397 domain-containing protein [Streptomyces]UFQ17335.1 DUF397 domain-containing protein [Streptomyces huasconensis]WCL86941.1 DUF397 domain-containing protein [Streptomyces sp. JCM 35825]
MNDTEPTWFKSSYSGGEGGTCLQVAYTWRKSSHSGGAGGECVEVAPCPHAIHIRDSKHKPEDDGPLLTVTPTPWTHFLAYATASAATATTPTL